MMKNKKRNVFSVIAALLFMLISGFQVFAAEATAEIQTPTGFYAVLVIVPLIVILTLLFLKVDMLAAGFVGGTLAMLIGGIGLAQANEQFLSTIPGMLSITVPIINSAIAMAVFKSGGYTAALALVRRKIGNKGEYMAAFIVILQAAATYMSGIGGGSAMVIAPLAFAAVGAIPELIAAMSIATAVSFTTSPASLESGIVSKLSGIPVADYVAEMRIFTLIFVVLSVILGFYGAKKRKVVFKGEENSEFANLNNGQLFKITIPAIFMLAAVILGPFVNKAIGFGLINPLVYTVVTVALIYVCTKFNLNESMEAVVDGSTYILTRLFAVGIFLSFINIIGDTGAFQVIASLAEAAPAALVVPAAVLAGILVGIPAGAYVGSILGLVLPVAVSLNFSPVALGFVAMGVGLGSQLSFVNITMQALSAGFQIPIIQVVKGNGKWVGMAMALLLVIAFFLG
ncbi:MULTISPECIES: citrate transporter [unclassified Virgibacillus]|uniref:citrate transporter n=1 Tax=unclassified Virgibacillus TaxID=2620237 RepID=UPI0024DDFADA|nr:citrate transporter [Virgibacillus sp. LDC-1]